MPALLVRQIRQRSTGQEMPGAEGAQLCPVLLGILFAEAAYVPLPLAACLTVFGVAVTFPKLAVPIRGCVIGPNRFQGNDHGLV